MTFRSPALRSLALLFLLSGLAASVAAAATPVAAPVAADATPAAAPAAAEAPRSMTGEWIRARLPAEWLRESTFILENWQWLGLLALALVGMVIDRAVVLVLRGMLGRLLRRRGGELARDVLRQGLRPLGYLAMALVWWIGFPVLNLEGQAREIIDFAVTLIMVSAVVWSLYRLVDVGSAFAQARAAQTSTRFDDLLVPMLRKAVKVFVVAFGLVFIADNLDIDISSMLAGLGIGGLAIALAAKDTVSNLFGSLTVLVDRPFAVGDWVVIDGADGTVEEISFRSTRIRTFYDSQITMPNAKLLTTIVDNYGRRRYRRWNTTLGIAYETPPERIEALCEGIRELVRVHPHTRKDYFHVYANAFGSSSIDVMIYVFHEVPDWSAELRERHRLMLDILRLANRLGVTIAYPTQLVYHAADPGAAEPAPWPEAGRVAAEGELGRREARAIAGAGLA
jgi:MscS family membrane protein